MLNLAIFAAFQTTTVAVALIVFYAYPALVTLGAVRLFGERLDRRRAAALVVASAGLLLVVLGPALAAAGVTVNPIGVALALLAAVSQSVHILVGSRGYSMVPSVVASSVILVGGALIYGVLLLVTGNLAGLLLPFSTPALWFWILAASITGAAIPATLLLAAMRLIGPSRAAIMMTLEPVVGVALAAIVLGEAAHLLQVVGGLGVLAAAVVLQAPPKQLPARAPASAEPPFSG